MSVRAAHWEDVLSAPHVVPWAEVIIDNWLDVDDVSALERLCASRPVAFHSVSLDPAGTDALDEARVARLRTLCDRFHPVAVSDHMAWVRFKGEFFGDLLPVPMTEQTVQHVARRTRQLADALGRPLLLENPSLYATFPSSSMDYGAFLKAVADEAQTQLVVDLNNIRVSERNVGVDAQQVLDSLDRSDIGYLHIAGFTDQGTHWLDTHSTTVADTTWHLYADAIQRWGPVPTIVERDDVLPAFATLTDELERAHAIRRHVTA